MNSSVHGRAFHLLLMHPKSLNPIYSSSHCHPLGLFVSRFFFSKKYVVYYSQEGDTTTKKEKRK